MELRQLRYFVRIVELGSMGRAALDLEMVQSALSQQVSRLEGELSTRLLRRTSRGVVATEARGGVFGGSPAHAEARRSGGSRGPAGKTFGDGQRGPGPHDGGNAGAAADADHARAPSRRSTAFCRRTVGLPCGHAQFENPGYGHFV